MTIRLVDDAAELLVAAIDAKVDEIITDATTDTSTDGASDGDDRGLSRREVIDQRGGLACLRAQAVTAIVVDGGVETTVMFTTPPHPGPDPDPDPERPGPVLERLACACRVNLSVTDGKGNPLSVGRETRVVPKRIRAALELRDHGMCRFPGCGSTRGLHAHHVIRWLNGGPTELDNLILVCSFHHHTIHDGGWNVERHNQDGNNSSGL